MAGLKAWETGQWRLETAWVLHLVISRIRDEDTTGILRLWNLNEGARHLFAYSALGLLFPDPFMLVTTINIRI